ncbi:MAG TPA: alkaline phosphatase family protein [Acidimicrobiales bacterium]
MTNVIRAPRWRTALVAGAVLVCLAGCASGAATPAPSPPAKAAVAAAPSLSAPCGRATTPPARYSHVVVMLEENRTWAGGRSPAVGMGFSATKMPFLHSLAAKCSYYTDWAETNASQDSLNQYIGLTSGVVNSHTVNDCSPSATCRSTDNNIFRQVRVAGGSPRSYVDGATTRCSAAGNAAKHIPALYYYGGTDHSHCSGEVVPLSYLDPNHLPTFAFITPNLCHDGHDCADANVDAWAKTTLTRILNGATYAGGKTLVVVTYDEDRPVPNLLIAPTAHVGAIHSPAGSHPALLKTVEQLLGLPVMNQGQLPTAISLRTSAHL